MLFAKARAVNRQCGTGTRNFRLAAKYRTAPCPFVMLNLFQHPFRLPSPSARVEEWTLKQVQGDASGNDGSRMCSTRSRLTKPALQATSRPMLDLLDRPRVLDFTTVVLGPYASQILGDLGADVIKIEPLTGDIFRAAGPGHSAEMGAGYLNLNRNKRSLAIDMRAPEARAAIDRLVAGADLVIHNMRPASAERLGISFERLSAINPRLAYVFAAGF